MNTTRGKQFFEKLNNEQTIDSTELRKGRSAQLISLRNEQLFYRYYYYGKMLNLKYAIVLKNLSNEFCLSSCTISDIITTHADVITTIYKDKPSIKDLTKKFPHFSWSVQNSFNNN